MLSFPRTRVPSVNLFFVQTCQNSSKTSLYICFLLTNLLSIPKRGGRRDTLLPFYLTFSIYIISQVLYIINIYKMDVLIRHRGTFLLLVIAYFVLLEMEKVSSLRWERDLKEIIRRKLKMVV